MPGLNKNFVVLSQSDNAAIDSVLKNMQDAWASGNGIAYASLFFEDATYVEAPGLRVSGNQMIGERHQKIFDTIFKYSRIDGKYYSEIQPLTNDVVLIHLEGNVFFPGEKSTEKIKPNGLVTICLLKRNDVWKIISFQNTPTGKFRGLKFMARFLFSRIYMFSAEWKKAEKYMLAEKQMNMEHWRQP